MTEKSPYITPQGYRALRDELDELWQRRHEVVHFLAAAAAEGDRSENAEYIYRKKQLRELDRRLRYVQKRLPDLRVVAHGKDNLPAPNSVYFGAWVTLCDDDGIEQCYRIVGADEFDPQRNWISVDSPVARALLGKALDNDVYVRVPAGEKSFVITAISYTEPTA